MPGKVLGKASRAKADDRAAAFDDDVAQETRETANPETGDQGSDAVDDMTHTAHRDPGRDKERPTGPVSGTRSRGRARWRGGSGTGLVVFMIGVLTLLAVVGATVLIESRLRATRDAADAATAAWGDSRDRINAARQLDAARALIRQVRHAPLGSAGGEARRVAMVKVTVLLRDPALRLLLSPDVRTDLDTALMALKTLATARTRPWASEEPSIAARLATLARFAAPADAPRGPSRESLIRTLHGVLAQAARAGVTALPVLERDARHLAARAIGAEGDRAEMVVGTRGSVFAAIEAAMAIPALRATEIATTDWADTLWHRVDGVLAGLGDRVLADGEDGLLAALEQQQAGVDRLAGGLLAVLLGALALGLVGFAATWASAVAPLARLGRRAVRLGAPGAGGQRAIADVLATVEDLQDRTMRAEAESNAACEDASVLRAALLGAAPEAALGRSLTTVAQELLILLGDIRAQATLARHECETLVPADHHLRGRGPRPLAPHQDRAARMILESCVALRDQCEFAAHLVGALRGLAGIDGQQRRSIDLTRTLEETLSVLAPKLRALGASVRLSCNEPVVVRGDPVALGAVLFYVVEGAVLRAEDAAIRFRSPHGDGRSTSISAAIDPDQGRLALNGSVAGAGAAPRLNGVSVAAVLESGGRVRLTIADDGPAPGPAVRDLERILDPSRSDGVDRTLVPALRDAPEAAALVLADALARAGLGCGLDVLAGEDWGLTVRLYLPLHASEDDG